MKSLFLAGTLAMISALPAFAADLIRVETAKTVPAVMDALEAAVGNAGATVFARIDHAAGAASVGLELADAQVLIFGNPKLGNPAMLADPVAGLYLPLKVLGYRDTDGKVWLIYQDPADMFEGLQIAGDAAVIARMQGALKKLTGVAAN